MTARRKRAARRHPPGRLDPGVRPRDVDVHVEVRPARSDRYRGTTRTRLELDRARRTIDLHAVDLRVTRVRAKGQDLSVSGTLGEMAVEAEVFGSGHFGEEHDLAGVLGEVFHCVVDGFELRHVVRLHRGRFGKLGSAQSADHCDCLRYCCFQPLAQFIRLNVAAGPELSVANTDVGFAGYSRSDPLPQIAAKVKDQVTDGVFVLRATCPDLLVAQLSQTRHDPVRQLLQFARGEFGESLFQVSIHTQKLTRNAPPRHLKLYEAHFSGVAARDRPFCG